MKKLLFVLTLSAALSAKASISGTDTIPGAFSSPMQWRVGVELSPAYVAPTNSFLTGDNIYAHPVHAAMSASLRTDFCFNPKSEKGMLYHGLYQGIGVDTRTFFSSRLLGTPVSAYVYQGAPFKHFGNRLWLGYEWRFGAAFGWRDRSVDRDAGFLNSAISTRVTAHMGLGLKLTYALAPRWQLSLGFEATHFSNGNTSFPNSGINTIGLSFGASYVFNRIQYAEAPDYMKQDADRPRWLLDILAYGAWRKRHVIIEEIETLLPGTYGVGGLQLSPMRKINRWLTAGLAIDMQYDRSAGLGPYWQGGYYDEATFSRPPFGKQLRIGTAAIAELTMPIFAISAGLGYDLLSPHGEMRFYQMLTVKAFVTDNIFLNAGYRLGNFKDPQNLMLGIGARIYR